MGSRENHQLGPWDLSGDASKIDRRNDGITHAPGRKAGHAYRGQLMIIQVAAKPGIFGCYLSASGGCRRVKVIWYFAALTGAFKTAQEAVTLCLLTGRVQLPQNGLNGGVGLAVDGLCSRRAENGLATSGVGSGED